MTVEFFKYQGTGNDFVLIDNRNRQFDNITTEQVARICHRRFGVGADGLMLLQKSENCDFEMVYYNSDGRKSTMCGNGGRCIAAFAYLLKVPEKITDIRFIAIDGKHKAEITNKSEEIIVNLQMIDIEDVRIEKDYYFLDTGSPHYVEYRNKVEDIDVKKEGSEIRYSDKFAPEGTNVNFVSINGNTLNVRTYERGVEDETYSCGTGSVAAAVSAYFETNKKYTSFNIKTKGGNLSVSFDIDKNKITDIWLKGEAKQVFKGKITL